MLTLNKNTIKLMFIISVVIFSPLTLAKPMAGAQRAQPTAQQAVPAIANPAAPVVRQPIAPQAPSAPIVRQPVAPRAPVAQDAPARAVAQVQQPMRASSMAKKHTKYAQTEAYLQRPELRKLVTDKFYDDFAVVNHMDIVSRVMAGEAELRDTHWAFYHGVSNIWTVWQDTYTALFNHFNPSLAQKGDADFIFLRTKGKANIKAKDFLVNTLQEHGLVDDTGEVKAILLSTNMFLFGNTGIAGESTWKYTMTDKTHAEPDRALYESIMDEFGLSYQYVNQLMDLVKLLQSKQQTLLQIFVPKSIVDDIGYLAWTKGIPAHQGSIDWVRKSKIKSEGGSRAVAALSALKDKFKNEQEKNPLFREMLQTVQEGAYSLDDYLTKCCNDPSAVSNMDHLQARLIFTDDVLLNAASGVKMYRYTGVPYRKMQEYKTRFDALIKQIVQSKK